MREPTDFDPASLAAASFELAADACYWMRHDARFVLVNRAATEMLGFTREQLLTRSVFDIDAKMTPEIWPEHWAELEKSRSFTIDSVHRRADGTEFPVEVSVHFVEHDGQAFNCALVRDVSERQTQKRQLQTSEALKAATIECALDCVITIDADGCIVDFNPAAETTFGHSKADVIGEKLRDIIIPTELRAMHDAGMEKYLTSGVGPVLNQRLELPALRSDGSRILVEIAISPIHVGSEPMFTAYLRDITERKATEQAILDARAAAERASEYKSRFLASMSHEIRTPLTAIVGYADLLTQSDSDADSQAEWSARVHDNTRYLLSLVDDILDFSKIEAGEQTIRATEIDLVATIGGLDAMFRPRADEKLLTFTTEFTSEVPKTATTDGTKLRQIVVNLLSNAIKATDTGQVGMRVGVSPSSADGEARLTLEVHDTGPGVAAEDQERLFQPFVQLDDGGSTPLRGTGLGLALAREFADLLGGDLALESELGQGTTFRLTVPLTRVSTYVQPSVPQRDLPAPAHRFDIPDLSGTRVLITDDNSDNRQILRYLLDPTKAEIALAKDGQDAIDTLRDAAAAGAPFDTLLLDMQMPVLNGYEVVRELRAGGPQCRVVAVTAYATTGDRQKCLSAGCDDYLTKPVDPGELYDALEQGQPTERSPQSMFDDPRFAALRIEFIASLAHSAAELDAARCSADRATIRDIAHRLKGTGSSFGFPGITQLATACEDAARSDEPLGDCLERLIDELNAISGAPKSR